MTNLSQRYIEALAQLSQFHCVVGGKETLTHVLTGVQVTAENTGAQAQDASRLRLTFSGGHSIQVVARLYLELQLAEDAAHHMHAVQEGSGEIHQRAAQTWERLSRQHHLSD